ncbi:hypothetical protein ACFQZT_27835 [Paenibacillus sp. GCM10027628]|uniref:hypothetical protein n=1 Tax=Paenibacillus sp. GCM10027628 TaxID=3273413 RepID=UPI003638F0CE
MANKYVNSKDLKEIKKWIQKLKAKKQEVDKGNKRKMARSNLNLPYKEISAGAHRIVYDIKDGFVLKVAISKKGIQCNEFEAKLYKKVKSSLKSHLAEVKDHGFGWIIMEKIKDEVSDNKKNKNKLLKIHKNFSKAGVKAGDIIRKDNKQPQWSNIRYRKKDKSIIVIDYGNFKYQ